MIEFIVGAYESLRLKPKRHTITIRIIQNDSVAIGSFSKILEMEVDDFRTGNIRGMERFVSQVRLLKSLDANYIIQYKNSNDTGSQWTKV
jgi:hypothetical protein